MRNMDSTAVGILSLQFDPDKYEHANLKLVSAIFYQTFINLSPNESLSKNMENAFYFI